MIFSILLDGHFVSFVKMMIFTTLTTKGQHNLMSIVKKKKKQDRRFQRYKVRTEKFEFILKREKKKK